MGRGLSELQRWILREARARGRLYYADICEGYFGWNRKPRGTLSENYNRQMFSRQAIGEKEYDRVMATISRSCLRLERRELVRCLRGLNWAAVEIAKGGREINPRTREADDE